MEQLAERLRDLRERAGLTRTALARPRYTVSYVSQIEAGRRKPSPEATAYFASRLGVSPAELATGVPEGLEDSLRYQLEQARTTLKLGDAEQAATIVEPVIHQARQHAMDRLGAEARVLEAEILARRGRIRDAIDAYEDALDGGHLPERETGRAVAAVARAYRDVGDLSYAIDVVERYLGRDERTSIDPSVTAELNAVLVSVYFERGDILRAERTAKRALRAADEQAPLDVRARAYWNASRVLAEARRWDEALDHATRARMLMEEVDDRRNVARLHNAYAFICLEAEPPRAEEAAFHLDRAEELFEGVAAGPDRAYLASERSRLALLTDRPEEALRYADVALAEVGDDALERARALFLKGRALAKAGGTADAGKVLAEAATLFGDHGARQQEAACWRELGELAVEGGDPGAALDALRAGLAALDPRRSRA